MLEFSISKSPMCIYFNETQICWALEKVVKGPRSRDFHLGILVNSVAELRCHFFKGIVIKIEESYLSNMLRKHVQVSSYTTRYSQHPHC